MRATRARPLLPVLTLCALLLPPAAFGLPGWHSTPVSGAGVARSAGYGALPLGFEPNRGQAPRDVRYLAHGAGYTLFLTSTGLELSLAASSPPVRGEPADAGPPGAIRPAAHESHRVLLQLGFSGASKQPRITAQQRGAGIVNYFIGNDPRHWHTNIPTYGRIVYHDLYPGIDLVAYGSNGQLEYDWLVHPHAAPGAIGMQVTGARSIRLEAGGRLALTTAVGVVELHSPVLRQMRGGKRTRVTGGYRLGGGNRIEFRVGRYDPSAALTIDPVLVYSTYFGAGRYVAANRVVVNSAGNAYITGLADAASTVISKNPYQAASAGGSDVFVAELNATGSDLIYSTYIGGSQNDSGYGIAIDSGGSAYITGSTFSSDFPGMPAGAPPQTYSVSYALKLSPEGNKLVYSHVDSTVRSSEGYVIAVDATGQAYYAGDEPGPTTAGATSTSFYIRKLDSAGTFTNAYSKGVTGSTRAYGIALDGMGSVYVVGTTQDPAFATPGSLRPTYGGAGDAYVVKMGDVVLNPIYVTYLGGSGYDLADGVATDPAGNVYVGGWTNSSDFPRSSALQNTLKGKTDSFLAELTPLGNAFVYSTYLGGSETASEAINGVALDATGNAYVTGSTDAPDFPLDNPVPRLGGIRGATDAFVAEVASGGQSLVFSTFLGGSKDDYAYGIALDGKGGIYVVGETSSTDFPTAGTPAPYQGTLMGTTDAFVSKLGPPPPAILTPTATSTPTPTATSTPVPTATSTSTRVPTATATSTRVPPPEKPQIFLKSARVNAGGKLKLTILTSPDASITATLQVTQDKVTLYRTSTPGQADSQGRWTKSITVSFHPVKATKARLTVKARTAGGSKSSSTQVIIQPHA